MILLTLIQAPSAKDKFSFNDGRNTVIESNISGVVLVATETKILFKEAFGLANRQENIPFVYGYSE